MSETKKLIDNVKGHTVLYDTAHEEYKNIRKKDKIWDEISQYFECSGEDLKKKWKNLRDSYSKHLRSLKIQVSGPETKIIDRYKTWPWAKQMDFLRPYVQKHDPWNPSPKNFDESNGEMDEVNNCNDFEEDYKDIELLQRGEESVVASTVHLPVSGKKRKIEDANSILKKNDYDWKAMSKKKGDLTNSRSTNSSSYKKQDDAYPPKKLTYEEMSAREQQMVAYMQETCSGDSNPSYDDVDLLFMSYAKTVKKFSKKRQTVTKFHFSQILMQAELEQLEENEEQIMETSQFARSSYSASPNSLNGSSVDEEM